MREAYFLAGARTPFCAWSRGRTGEGARGGALAGEDPFDLAAAALTGALGRGGLKPAAVGRLRFANMYQDGPHGCYGGRYAALRAGLPEEVPAMTLHMSCGSGLHAVIEAARDVLSGEADIVAAAGADAPSRQPKEIFFPSFTDIACGKTIGALVEASAREAGIGREEADRWAELSHARSRAAREDGRLSDEIAAAGVFQDDAVLPEGSDAVRRARPIRGGSGLVTPANTHALADGGAAALLSSSREGALGKILSWGYAAVKPEDMAAASVPAVRAALSAGGLKPEDVDLYDINETFAAQVLLDARALGIEEDRLNARGGAISLGHPFAATGLRQVLGLFLELKNRGLRRGVAAICMGGGQGVALAVESL